MRRRRPRQFASGLCKRSLAMRDARTSAIAQTCGRLRTERRGGAFTFHENELRDPQTGLVRPRLDQVRGREHLR